MTWLRAAPVLAMFAAFAAFGVACGSGVRIRSAETLPPVSVDPLAANAPDGGRARIDFGAEPPVELVVAEGRICARLGASVRCSATAPDGLAAAASSFAEPVVSLGASSGLCAVTKSGAVLCQGQNDFGQLGAGLREKASAVPVRVKGVANAKEVRGGDGFFCALLADGRVSCWGRNERGQTGGDVHVEPDARELVVPSLVPGVQNAIKIAVAGDAACAVTRERGVVCWGGFTTPDEDHLMGSFAVFPVPDVADVEDISGDTETFCVASRGDVSCWGEVGLLVPEHGATLTPVKIEGLGDIHRIGVGYRFACAIAGDGGVWCWGDGADGKLGRGPSATVPPTPALVDVPPAVGLALFSNLACSVTAAADVSCWGIWPRPYDANDPNGSNAPRAQKPVALRVAAPGR